VDDDSELLAPGLAGSHQTKFVPHLNNCTLVLKVSL